MSKITTLQVEQLAKLARVGLTNKEIEALSLEMSAILDYAKRLDEVDVNGVEPTSQVTGLVDVTRIDEVERSEITRDELLSNTQNTEDGFIKVKAVL
jgi:aspartyl-tRNA(Asn)/glutamyl-tRNA(Gln) amidotransferase subunit C